LSFQPARPQPAIAVSDRDMPDWPLRKHLTQVSTLAIAASASRLIVPPQLVIVFQPSRPQTVIATHARAKVVEMVWSFQPSQPQTAIATRCHADLGHAARVVSTLATADSDRDLLQSPRYAQTSKLFQPARSQPAIATLMARHGAVPDPRRFNPRDRSQRSRRSQVTKAGMPAGAFQPSRPQPVIATRGTLPGSISRPAFQPSRPQPAIADSNRDDRRVGIAELRCLVSILATAERS